MMSHSKNPSNPCPRNDTDDLCHLFEWTAWKTWRDLYDSQRLGLSISEESITDMLLLEMLRRTKRIACKKFTRAGERKSGADWQWWFISGYRGFPIRIQAKRLYSGGRYEALKYKKGSKHDQTNTLLRIARIDGFLPLFCFYNYWGSKTFPQNSNYGCALASARLVKEHLLKYGSKENIIASIKPLSVPWSDLVCSNDHSGMEFPEAVRNRVMQIPGIWADYVPEICALPLEVQELIGKVPGESDLSRSEPLIPFGDHLYPTKDRNSVAGIVAVSDQPIERMN